MDEADGALGWFQSDRRHIKHAVRL